MKRSMLVLLVAAAVTLGLATSVGANRALSRPARSCSPEGASKWISNRAPCSGE